LLFSGKCDLENSKKDEHNKWSDVLELITGKQEEGQNNKILPKIIWLETNLSLSVDQDEENKFDDFLKDNNINKPSFSMPSPNNGISSDDKKFVRHYWQINSATPICHSPKNAVVSLTTILDFTNNSENEIDLMFNDCGFLFTFGDNTDAEKFPDQSLSDGEHSFLNRYALLSILKDCEVEGNKEKYLILLDEPETHFNEFWKTEFLYLLEETLNGCPHDVFIASHSAMLVTDAKKNEIHRFEARSNGTVVYPTPINTFGVNVIDIGKALFQMESDIGRRSRDKIEVAIKNRKLDDLNKLLREVGPGEWRWKIRTAIKEIEHINRTKKKV
jgi:hypothetical protein